MQIEQLQNEFERIQADLDVQVQEARVDTEARVRAICARKADAAGLFVAGFAHPLTAG